MWHPAFLALADSLEGCAKQYRKFCKRYKPKAKSERRYHWGSKLLPKVLKNKQKTNPNQLKLNLPSWQNWKANNPEITAVAEKFVIANCYKPEIVA